MDQEIRVRLPAPLHTAITAAAHNRGVSITSLVSIMAYEYLHTRGELVAAPAPAKPTPAPAKPTYAISDEDKKALAVFFADDEDEKPAKPAPAKPAPTDEEKAKARLKFADDIADLPPGIHLDINGDEWDDDELAHVRAKGSVVHIIATG